MQASDLYLWLRNRQLTPANQPAPVRNEVETCLDLLSLHDQTPAGSRGSGARPVSGLNPTALLKSLSAGPVLSEGGLSTLATFFVSQLTILSDSQFSRPPDLVGRRVSMPRGCGMLPRLNVISLFDPTRFLDRDWLQALSSEQSSLDDARDMFVNHMIDAIVLNTPHPSPFLSSIVSGQRKVSWMPVAGIEPVLEKFPFIVPSTIDTRLYADPAEESIPTLAIPIVLIARDNAPTNEVYQVMRILLEHLDELRELHPVLAHLDTSQMKRGGLFLNQKRHPGAIQAFNRMCSTAPVPRSSEVP